MTPRLAWAGFVPALMGLALLLAPLLALTLAPGPAWALDPVHLNAPAQGCQSCHALHNAQGGRLFKAADFSTTCLTCHGSGGIAVLVDFHTNVGRSSPYPDPDPAKGANHTELCEECHTPHNNLPNYLGLHDHRDPPPRNGTPPPPVQVNGVNVKLLGREITYDDLGNNLQVHTVAKLRRYNPALGAYEVVDLVAESRGSGDAAAGGVSLHSFADGQCLPDTKDSDVNRCDGTRTDLGDGNLIPPDAYQGLCESCHTQTGHHRFNDPASANSDHTHNVGKTCPSCHTHSNGFYK